MSVNDLNPAAQLTKLLKLRTQPIAIAFRDSAPEGMDRIEEAAPAGCSYWKYAAQGRTFYTEASDHFGCPIGSYTHGIDLPEETAEELEGLLGTMVELQYISREEVPDIPRRGEPFGVALYSPLASAAFEPGAILILGNARQMMLLAEAAHAAGLETEGSLVGRPTCAAIPAVLQSGRTATNLGCIGNRVYADLADDELYFAVAGPQLGVLLENLSTIAIANRELEAFHRGRLSRQSPSGDDRTG